MLYLFWCANEHNQFRLAEFEALAQVLDIELKWNLEAVNIPGSSSTCQDLLKLSK